jgi:sulfate adenylyltransferase subunit 2
MKLDLSTIRHVSALDEGSSLPRSLPAPRALPAELRQLESEAIEIVREVAAGFQNPVLLYSAGKDSTVLLHIARKAFFPGPIPFPLLHIDTTWKFREMTSFRDRTAEILGLRLIVHVNEEGLRQGVTAINTEPSLYTHVMKTQALKQALDKHRFDAAIGGARRDEERSRAKERIFSLRSKTHVWDPRDQRPELWNLYNTRLKSGESFRVFPLSNWTELDVWKYIVIEGIQLVSLYYAKERAVVRRGETWIVVDDDRLPLGKGESPELRRVRFRTVGCYPLTGAVDSEAYTPHDILAEIESSRLSERADRLIDSDEASSMENKKREGYF